MIDYQFGITRHSRRRDCGTANVFPARGQEVWGVVYDVDDGDLAVLDGFEDGYRRETLVVRGAAGQPLRALVYVAELERNVPLPNAEYKRLIVEGAKHWRVPRVYLASLEAIEIAQALDRPVSPGPAEAKSPDDTA